MTGAVKRLHPGEFQSRRGTSAGWICPARPPPQVRMHAAVLLLAVATALSGCEKVKGLLSRGGVQFFAPLTENREVKYRTQVSVIAPRWESDGLASENISLALTIRCRNIGEADADWIQVRSEILEGVYTIDQTPRLLQLAGRRLSYKYSRFRRIAQMSGPAFPTGVELLDIGPPQGRVKEKENWKIEVTRVLLLGQEEVKFTKFFTYVGKGDLNGAPYYKLSVRIPAVKTTLRNGAVLEFTGSGVVWIGVKDGRVLKSTEILQGQLRDEKISPEAGRFAHEVILYEAAVAPPVLSVLSAKPAPTASTPGKVAPVAGTAIPAGVPDGQTAEKPAQPPKAAAKPPTPAAAAAPKPSTSPTAVVPAGKLTVQSDKTPAAKAEEVQTEERLVFVSYATGESEVWSAAADGSAKECLTGYAFAHWSPAMDPEGRVLVCASKRTRGINLWQFSLGAAESLALTEFSENEDIQVGWAHGGQRLVLLKSGKFWSVHRDGFNLQTFKLGGEVVDFAVTGKSSQVAVVVNELGQRKIMVVDVLSGGVRDLAKGDQPSWSPDAEMVAYRGEDADAVYVSNADGTLARPVLNGAIVDAPILWHPKGKKLACTVLEAGRENVVMVAVSEAKAQPRDPDPVTKRGGKAQVFSPTGDRIAYLLYGDLWIASVDGNVHTRVTRDGATRGPIWWGKHDVR